MRVDGKFCPSLDKTLCGGPGLEAGSREMNKKCMLTQRLGLKWGREIQAVVILSFKFDDSDDHRRL